MLTENPRLYDCDHCAENPFFYQQLGHDGPPAGGFTTNLADGAELQRCPRLDVLQAAGHVRAEVDMVRVELYPLYRSGHLPVAGGVLDQPARLMDFMRTFDRVAVAVQASVDRITSEDGDA